MMSKIFETTSLRSVALGPGCSVFKALVYFGGTFRPRRARENDNIPDVHPAGSFGVSLLSKG